MKRLMMVGLLLFTLTWRGFDTCLKSGVNDWIWTQTEVCESDFSRNFNTKAEAVKFVRDHDGDRKVWDFKLYELVERKIQ